MLKNASIIFFFIYYIKITQNLPERLLYGQIREKKDESLHILQMVASNNLRKTIIVTDVVVTI